MRKRKIISAVFYVILAVMIICSILAVNLRQADTVDIVVQTITDGTEETVYIDETACTETTEYNSEKSTSYEEKVLIEDFPHISQKPYYPTGCESVAAVSLMQFYGIDITVDEFIELHLPISDYPFYEDDVMYGGNPWDAFIGDPYSDSGYGCYSTAVVKAMISAVPDDYEIRAVYNLPLSVLCEQYIDEGIPVMIWATMEMKKPYEGNSWILPDGRTFTFISPEHALILIGYDDSSYYFCNPQSDEKVVSYPKTDCETAYNAMYRQAVAILPV